MLKIGALWEKKKDGKTYRTGVIEWPGVKARIGLFANEQKAGPNHPDYHIVLLPDNPGPAGRTDAPENDIPW